MPRSASAFLPPLQPLLLWQVWTLCWLCGLAASRWFLPSLTALLLIVAADSRLRHPARLLAATLICAVGWGVATLLQPHRPDTPPHWVQTAHNAPPVRLTGTVSAVQGLPDRQINGGHNLPIGADAVGGGNRGKNPEELFLRPVFLQQC